MTTHFYNRTLFNILGETIPNSYLELDSVYDQNCTNYLEATKKYLVYSENICKRHSDIIFYKKQIVHEYNLDNNPFESCLILTTYLIGYFSAVKSFIDAISICLNKIYSLGLSPLNQDLTREEIWRKLEGVDAEDYKGFKPFFKELINWRNKSSHQLTPIVGVHGPSNAIARKSPDQIRKADVEIKMANLAGLNSEDILECFTVVEWVTPLFYLDQWEAQITKLSTLICQDIGKSIKN